MKDKNFYKYYFFLLIILCTWFSQVYAPPLPLRLIYLVALIAPICVGGRHLLVPVLTCFTALATYGISCSYMPTEKFIYLLIVSVCLFVNFSKLRGCQRPPLIIVLFCTYVWFVDLFNGSEITNIDYSLLIIMLSFFFVSKDSYEVNSFILAFLVVTIVLSIFFFTYGQSSSVEVSETGQRSWVDPNYFGNVCGMGVVLAYNIIVNKYLSQNLLFKRLAIFTVVGGLLLLVMNASRGAFLSVSISIVTITLLSSASLKKKIWVVFLLMIGIGVMYYVGVVDVLTARLMDGDDTGNGRTMIWEAKMFAYTGLTVLEKFIGIGYDGGFFLAIPGGYGFHNDYLAFLVDYGIIGLILFVCLMIYPIMLVSKRSSMRVVVFSIIIFLLTCSMTLEPFTLGSLTFWYFYMFSILLARWSRSNVV